MKIQLKHLIAIIFICTFLITIVFMSLNSISSALFVNEQILRSYDGTMRLYLQMLDRTLHIAQLSISNFVSTKDDVLYLAESNDVTTNTLLARQNIHNSLKSNSPLSSSMDGAFLYTPGINNLINCVYATMSVEEMEALHGKLFNYYGTTHATQQTIPIGWNNYELGSRQFLIWILPFSDSYLGVYISLDSLLYSLRSSSFLAVDDICMLDTEGEVLSEKLANNKINANFVLPDETVDLGGEQYGIVRASLSRAPYTLAALVRTEEIVGGLRKNYLLFVPLFALMIVFMVLLFVYTRSHLLKPLEKLMDGMKRFQKGETHMLLNEHMPLKELALVNQTFNQMTKEVTQLKIDNYESKLWRRKTELHFFQLQIQPHFLINSLNTVYALAEVRSFDLIQKLTLFLVNYYRYLLKNTSHLVRLHDELSHVENYLKIHQMRFHDNLDVCIDVPEELHKMAVPLLILQTFVENTIQYAASMDDVIMLGIEVRKEKENSENLHITITDTGNGFPQSLLDAVRSQQPLSDGTNVHIGIFNVQQRLQLIYEGRASLELTNTKPQGARVDITLPIEVFNESKETVPC